MELKQDLPPPGGFKPVQYERVPLKKFWPGPMKWLIMFGAMGCGWYAYYLDKKRHSFEQLEKHSARLSIYPLLLAESDRLKLKMYRKLRDEENELMKDVEGWKVGTYKGEPVYKTLGPDEWYDPMSFELWAHSHPSEKKFPITVMYNN